MTITARTTERLQTLERALEAAEERFTVLFRESGDPVLLLSVDGDVLAANRTFETLTGITAAELFREEKGWHDLLHQEDLPRLLKCFTHPHGSQSDVSTCELRVRRPWGEYVWFEWSLSALHSEAGEVRGILAVARDIHQRVERESRLVAEARTIEQRHQRAQAMVGSLQDFFMRTNGLPDRFDEYASGICGILQDMYRAAGVMAIVQDESGKPVVYHAGKEANTSCTVRDLEDLPQMCRQVLEQQAALYFNNLGQEEDFKEDFLVRDMGVRTYLGAPLRDATGRVLGTLSVVDTETRDFDSMDVELVTVAALHLGSRLRADEQERKRAELEDHLRRVQKMEAVGLLAGGIAHDFNNILSGILGFSSYLLSKVDPDSDTHRDLGMIEQAAVRGADLTNQLLSFTRQKHLPKAPVEVNKLVQDVASLLKRSISKKICLDIDLDQAAPMVLADAGQMNQVIMNLALNSADALKEHPGRIQLKTLVRELNQQEKTLFSNLNDEAEYVVLTVMDDGPGIQEEAMEKVFDPFFTTKSSSGGTGLGLSIVYGIVDNHGGAVTVDSLPDTQTTFSIYLPLLKSSAIELPAGDESEIALNGNETILVIDDEQILRQMVSEVLKGYGYHVLTAAGGQEGLDIYRELPGRIDLVLLDMVMPGMDGEETFHALKKEDPLAGILLTSGFTNESRYQRLIEAGALGMVHKPYKVQTLLRKLRSLCSKRREAPSL